jgi:hypothetical protein
MIVNHENFPFEADVEREEEVINIILKQQP